MNRTGGRQWNADNQALTTGLSINLFGSRSLTELPTVPTSLIILMTSNVDIYNFNSGSSGDTYFLNDFG